MKKFIVILLAATMLSMTGCGFFEKFYDNASYESLTDEKVEILRLYSGGVLIAEYHRVLIIYSDSDNFALWYRLADGTKKYWQGEADITFPNSKLESLYDMVGKSRK